MIYKASIVKSNNHKDEKSSFNRSYRFICVLLM